MNVKIKYQNDANVRFVVLPVDDPETLDNTIARIEAALAPNRYFLPAKLGFPVLPMPMTWGKPTLQWYQLVSIQQTEDEAQEGKASLEKFADTFEMYHDSFCELRESLNTEISYMYRDADNYKLSTSVVLRGEITESQKAQILGALDDGEFFIPDMVSLPPIQFETETAADHPFCTLDLSDFRLTDQDVTLDITLDELVAAFVQAADNNWGNPVI